MKLDQVRRFALSLPETAEAPHFNFAAYRVRGKIFVTVPPGDTHVHVFVDDADRERALALHPQFVEKLTWGEKAVGVRVTLAGADPAVVNALVLAAWRRKAPKTVLRAFDAQTVPATAVRLLDRLRGADRRSIGAADALAAQAAGDPTAIAELVSGLDEADAVLRMRCADVLEKATRDDVALLAPHAAAIAALVNPNEAKDVLWHALQMAPRLRWAPARLSALFAAAEACLRHDSSIVKACALQCLHDLLPQAPQHRDAVTAMLRRASTSGTPAMRARARKLLKGLDG